MRSCICDCLYCHRHAKLLTFAVNVKTAAAQILLAMLFRRAVCVHVECTVCLEVECHLLWSRLGVRCTILKFLCCFRWSRNPFCALMFLLCEVPFTGSAVGNSVLSRMNCLLLWHHLRLVVKPPIGDGAATLGTELHLHPCLHRERVFKSISFE
jgi:hypothetical protein